MVDFEIVGGVALGELAGSRGHQELTPEHLLLALLDQQDGITGALLRKVGIDAAQVRQAAQSALDAQPQVRGSSADIYLGRRLTDRQTAEVLDDMFDDLDQEPDTAGEEGWRQ